MLAIQRWPPWAHLGGCFEGKTNQSVLGVSVAPSRLAHQRAIVNYRSMTFCRNCGTVGLKKQDGRARFCSAFGRREIIRRWFASFVTVKIDSVRGKDFRSALERIKRGDSARYARKPRHCSFLDGLRARGRCFCVLCRFSTWWRKEKIIWFLPRQTRAPQLSLALRPPKSNLTSYKKAQATKKKPSDSDNPTHLHVAVFS